MVEVESVPETVGQAFLRATRYENMAASDQSRGVAPPPLESPAPEGAALFDLPAPAALPAGPAVDLRALVEGRRSLREYAPAPVTLPELADLLWCSQGVKRRIREVATLRTVPSAGARHALETYLLANRVEGLAPGLYRYRALEHGLALVSDAEAIADRVTQACLGQEMVRASAVTFAWTAVPYRMTWRYGERGYRYLYLDAGHACQNLYLAAEAHGLGACAIAAFDDALLDAALGVDGVTEFGLYLAAVGRKPDPASPRREQT